MIRPASARTERWCDTVGWLLPTGSSRSQLHAVPSGAAAISDRRRSRTGSASALKAPASSSASSSASGAASSGAQHGLDRWSHLLHDDLLHASIAVDTLMTVHRLPSRRPPPCPESSSPSTSPTSTRPSTSTRSSSPPSRPSASPATPTSPSPTRRSSSSSSRTPAPTPASTTSASRSPTATRCGPHQSRLTDEGVDVDRGVRHLLLRQAGQGLGRRPRRRLGDLRGPRRQRRLRPELAKVDDPTGDSLCCASVPEAEARCC